MYYKIAFIFKDKLMEVVHHLLPATNIPESPPVGRNQAMWFPEREISVESFVVGALEATFHQMVSLYFLAALKKCFLFN